MENFPDTGATDGARNALTYRGFDGSSVKTDYPVALVADAAADLELRLDYDPGLIGAAPAGDLLGDVVTILEAFAADPAATIAALPPVRAVAATTTTATVSAGAPAPTADAAVVAQLAGLYTDLLGVPAGADDDFFTLGGDSVLVIRLAGRARRSGLPLKPQVVFAHRTPAAVAAALAAESETRASTPVADGPLLELSAAERDRVAAATERTVVDVWPLSPLQAGIYFQARYAENAAVYILQNVIERCATTSTSPPCSGRMRLCWNVTPCCGLGSWPTICPTRWPSSPATRPAACSSSISPKATGTVPWPIPNG